MCFADTGSLAGNVSSKPSSSRCSSLVAGLHGAEAGTGASFDASGGVANGGSGVCIPGKRRVTGHGSKSERSCSRPGLVPGLVTELLEGWRRFRLAANRSRKGSVSPESGMVRS